MDHIFYVAKCERFPEANAMLEGPLGEVNLVNLEQLKAVSKSYDKWRFPEIRGPLFSWMAFVRENPI